MVVDQRPTPSSAPSSSSAIPCLPGYDCNPWIRTDFRKIHHFDRCALNDQCITPPAPENVAVDQLPIGTDVRSADLDHSASDIVAVPAPNWIANGSLVCRFFLYQLDERFCKTFALCFYLEDESISIGQQPDRSRLSSGAPPRQG